MFGRSAYPSGLALLFLLGCGGGTPVEQSPEQAACANLGSLGECTVGGTDEEACVASLMQTRTRLQGDGACREQYDAYIACMTSLSSCPSGPSGSVCPEEISALGACGI
jgi:hypothetical protein